jgi:hypothetical protein
VTAVLVGSITFSADMQWFVFTMLNGVTVVSIPRCMIATKDS